MSEHFERAGECLPDAMIKSIIASKSVGQGLFNLRQIFHGKYDSSSLLSFLPYFILMGRCSGDSYRGEEGSHEAVV